MMKQIQRLGRSLMLPVATLPVAAILAGIGNWILGFSDDNIAGLFIRNAGTAILDHLGILFAVGVSIGLSKDKHGSAGISGLVGFLVVTTLTSVDSAAEFQNIDTSNVNPAFKENDNVFIGILTGLISSIMYNRFSDVKLPDALAFFSGKRLAPIMSAAAMIVVAVIMFFVWPFLYEVLVSFGEGMSKLGSIGAGLFGFFNRLLIPTGLHYALDAVFWYDIAGINDATKFLASEGTKGVTGQYLGGFFPIMMFGLPGAALAMYHTAKPSAKKVTGSLMLAGAIASFFTGVTEPLEFVFMFLAPSLLVLHALLTGLSLFIASLLQWTGGFAFSAGFVDFFLSLSNPIASKPYMLVIQGLVFAVLYYFTFRFMILKFNLKTPGREDESESDMDQSNPAEQDNQSSSKTSKKNNDADLAAQIYYSLGGDSNVTYVDYCATRLRVEVKDMDKVDQNKIKSSGVPGVSVMGKHNIQIVIGTSVQFVADEVNKIRGK